MLTGAPRLAGECFNEATLRCLACVEQACKRNVVVRVRCERAIRQGAEARLPKGQPTAMFNSSDVPFRCPVPTNRAFGQPCDRPCLRWIAAAHKTPVPAA